MEFQSKHIHMYSWGLWGERRKEARNAFIQFFYQVVLGSVFENDEKNYVLLDLFVFSKRKTKRLVSGLLFWFENEIVDAVLSNCF